jgi:hypothetical protein
VKLFYIFNVGTILQKKTGKSSSKVEEKTKKTTAEEQNDKNNEKTMVQEPVKVNVPDEYEIDSSDEEVLHIFWLICGMV